VRIAINLEQLFYRAPGGTGRYAARLASTMAAQFSSDQVVPFLAWHSRGEMEAVFEKGSLGHARLEAAVRLPFPRPFLFDLWHDLRWPPPTAFSAALRSTDLVHMPYPAVPPVAKPLVVTVFDAGPALFPDAYPRRGVRFHARALMLAAKRASAVITATQAAASEIAANTPVPAELMKVVPLGVDQSRADPARTGEVLARHGLSGTPYILWVGSLEPRKNVGALVRAFVKLVKSGAIPHRLVLVGPLGWLHHGLISDQDRAVLGERLRALGALSEDDLRSIYAGASVLAFPSLHEGFGMPVLEAMVQGVPVVCSDIATLAEVSGGAALRVPPEDIDGWAGTLAQVVQDPKVAQPLVDAGYQRAAQFTWERTAQATHCIYEQLAESGK